MCVARVPDALPASEVNAVRVSKSVDRTIAWLDDLLTVMGPKSADDDDTKSRQDTVKRGVRLEIHVLARI